jgi:hypothetical protein
VTILMVNIWSKYSSGHRLRYSVAKYYIQPFICRNFISNWIRAVLISGSMVSIAIRHHAVYTIFTTLITIVHLDGQNAFAPSNSSTFVSVNTGWVGIQYDDNSSAVGVLGMDRVCLDASTNLCFGQQVDNCTNLRIM